jgi:deoxycytidine triphosphate deaminase
MARDRAAMFRDLDPFRSVPRTLLSSAEIEDYVRVTAMLHPFYPKREFLKSASYEARPGGKFIRWDEKGNRIVDAVKRGGKYILPANSISFMQIEPKVRLPNYIAIRFNLRIKHVHRGLLLGTGPLVDPGFSGDLLIPLHNLTSDPYEIAGDEGLIWIEFTKTSLRVSEAEPEYLRRADFRPIEQRKTDVPPEVYFEKANGNNPVRSSIPDAIRQSADRASKAVEAADAAAASASTAEATAQHAERRARTQASWYLGTSALAILVGGVTLYEYFGEFESNVQATYSLASTINSNADQAKADAANAVSEGRRLKAEVDRVNNQLDSLEKENATIRAELDRAKERIDALRSRPVPIPPQTPTNTTR